MIVSTTGRRPCHFFFCCEAYKAVIRTPVKLLEQFIKLFGTLEENYYSGKSFCTLFLSSCETKFGRVVHYHTNKLRGGLVYFSFISCVSRGQKLAKKSKKT